MNKYVISNLSVQLFYFHTGQRALEPYFTLPWQDSWHTGQEPRGGGTLGGRAVSLHLRGGRFLCEIVGIISGPDMWARLGL